MGKRLIVTAFAVVGFASPVLAAPVTFFGEDVNTTGDPNQAVFTNATAARNSFFKNLSGVGTETFESFAPGASPPIVLSFPGAGKATLNGSGNIASGNDGAGRYAFSGSQYYEAGTDNFGVTFSAPISAFGFYGTDIGDFGGQLTLTLLGSGGSKTLVVPNTIGGDGSTSGSNLYFGFYDTVNTYTSITFGNNSGGSDVFAFDDLSVGSISQVTPSPAPEPASWAMMVGGFGLVGGALRRSRQKCVSFA